MSSMQKVFGHSWTAARGGKGKKQRQARCVGGAGSSLFSMRCSAAIMAALLCGTAALVGAPAAHAQGAGEGVTAAGLPQGHLQGPGSAPSCRQIDRDVGIRSWEIHSPSSCDTLLDDFGGWRSALASAGFGISLFSLDNYNSNILHDHTPVTVKTQAFGGQVPTLSSLNSLYISYSLRSIGDPDGQLVLGGSVVRNTWINLGPSDNSLSAAYWYQSLFDKTVEFKIGYLSTALEYIGAQLGGTLAGGANGISASIQYAQGFTPPTLSTPGVSVTYNINRDFYDKIGLVRSTDPAGSTPNFTLNKYSTRFEIPGQEDGALAINEFGYRHRPTENSNFKWIRAGVFHNDSGFPEFSNRGATSHSTVEYILGDYQVRKIGEGGGNGGPDRGFYVGGTFINANCNLSLFCKYAEVRLYGIGILPSRPGDIVSVIVNHSNFSGEDEAAIHLVAPHVAQTAVTLSYLAKIVPGWYINGGLGYTEHPAFGSSITTTTTQSYASSLNVLLNTSIFF